jgi:predicted AlkP superfamily phosphohydrolase/phosphomutase
VNINLAGREEAGGVVSADFERVRDEVAAVLLDARDPETGVPILKGVVTGSGYFHGDFATEAPDLVLQFHDGYAYGTTMGKVLFPWPYCQGVHRREGIIAAAGPSIRESINAGAVSIMDVAPTVLSILGIPIPEGTDGRAASEILRTEREVEIAAVSQVKRDAAPSSYSDEEEEAVRERLRGLGYID